jgi:hypothetical protein
MENHTSRENVANGMALSCHIADIDYLGCHKARSTTADEQITFLVSISGQAKIANSHFPSFTSSEHHIFGLQIAVDDAQTSQMSQALQQSLQDTPCFLLF